MWVGLFIYDMLYFAHGQILCVLTIMVFGQCSINLPDNIHILTSMQESRAWGLEGLFHVMYVFHNLMVFVLVKSLQQELDKHFPVSTCLRRELRASHVAKPC